MIALGIAAAIVIPRPETVEAMGKTWHNIEAPGDFRPGRFPTAEVACVALAAELVPEPRWLGPIVDYCLFRVWASSRGNRVVSRVDGSQIHDRDRLQSWRTVNRLTRGGWLRPNECEYHRVHDVPHPPKCRALVDQWSYRSPKMTPERREKFLAHSHDAERYGARGPIDVNANAYVIVPGCYPIEWLDDPGIAAYITIKHTIGVCYEVRHNTGMAGCTLEQIKRQRKERRKR